MSTLIKNKKAYFDYEILDTYEAGLVLEGWEVKSIKYANANLNDAFVRVSNGEAFVSGMHVSRWKTQSKSEPIDKERDRKLLLTSNEIEKLERARTNPGLTILVLEIFAKRGYLKAKIGVAKGRKKYDKRRRIREREEKKSIKEVGNVW